MHTLDINRIANHMQCSATRKERRERRRQISPCEMRIYLPQTANINFVPLRRDAVPSQIALPSCRTYPIWWPMLSDRCWQEHAMSHQFLWHVWCNCPKAKQSMGKSHSRRHTDESVIHIAQMRYRNCLTLSFRTPENTRTAHMLFPENGMRKCCVNTHFGTHILISLCFWETL